MSSALPRLARTAAIGVALGYGALLVLYRCTGKWILDSQGHPMVVDFISFYAAGDFANRGDAARAYDWQAMHTFHEVLVGHGFAGFFGWPYPPLFFLAAMAAAALPYAAGFLVWIGAGVAGYALVLRRIGGARAAWMGLALPPALACALVGQTGFVVAALFGGLLLCLPRRPWCAAWFALLLTIKPQFGILIPLALIAGGQWRALLAASLLISAYGVLAWIAAPALALGFLHNLAFNNSVFLGQGSSGFAKLESVYALARFAGLSGPAAWALQLPVTLAMAGLVIWAWRRRGPDNANAAMLVAATLLATPYAYFYDLPLLALPLAFLWRDRIYDLTEQLLFAALILCLALNTVTALPFGLGASGLALAMAARRRWQR